VSFVPAYQNSSMTPQPKASPPWLPAYTIIIGKAPAKTVTDPTRTDTVPHRKTGFTI